MQIDVKNKEIEGEDHLKQITERQIGRLESELRKLEKLYGKIIKFISHYLFLANKKKGSKQ